MRGSARLATYLGRIMVAAGLIIMLLGWNFAAGLDYAQGQLPFVLSASIPGLALVIIGMSLEYVQTVRELTARRAREATQVDAAMSRLLGFVRDGGGLGYSSPDTEITIPPGDQSLAALQAVETAYAPPVSAPAATAVAEPEAPMMVVAGRSSYHDQSCRLVSNRDDMQVLERGQAEANGLSPCRVCKP